MNTFLRQMAVLGILTTLAEHLLPEGGLRKAGRMVMGLMMMLTILTSILNLLKLPLPDIEGLMRFQQQAELSLIRSPGSYRDAVLGSLQRQVESCAQRAAEDAGYSDVLVNTVLTDKGEITDIRLHLLSLAVPAFAGESVLESDHQNLREKVAQALNLPVSLIHVEAGGT